MIKIADVIRPRVEKVQPQDWSELPFIGLDDIEAHTMRLLGTKLASDLKSAAKRFYPGDVLYSRLRPYLNKVWCADRQGICSSEFIILPVNDYVDSKFLTFRLNAADFVDFANSLNAGDRPRVDFDQISSFFLPPFSLKRQRQIVAKIEALFSELDKGVESLKTAREQLKVYRQAVLKHAFEGKLTAQWREENADKLEPPEQLLAHIKKEREAQYQQQLADWKAAVKAWETNGKEGKKPGKPRAVMELPGFSDDELEILPSLPVGWAWIKIDKICYHDQNAIKAGPFGSALKKEFYTPTGYKIYGQEQVISGDSFYGDYFISEDKFVELEACKIKPFDILISLVGTVGKVLILPEGAPPGIINPRLIKISPNISAYDPRFFKYYFESAFVRGLYKTRTHGATMDVMNLSILQSLPFPLCSLEEQSQIIEKIESVDSEIENLEKLISTQSVVAGSLRQSILKKAFSGQLVPQNPNDEPASVLLEQIKAEKAQRIGSKSARNSTRKTRSVHKEVN